MVPPAIGHDHRDTFLSLPTLLHKLMQAAMLTRRETETLTNSLNTGVPSQVIRADATQALLRASRRDCNNSRNRFIPRARLADIINADLVGRILQAIPGNYTDDANHRKGVVELICPVSGKCSCGGRDCLGRRMILATLLFCGREDLIYSFLPPENTHTCDSNLPFRFNLPGVPNYGLKGDERELFDHFQWQVYTPFLTGITSAKRENEVTIPKEASLPWMVTTRMGEKTPGEVSYVETVEIHHQSHDLVSWSLVLSARTQISDLKLCVPQDKTNVFALKTFEQRLAHDLSERRFRREVTANLEVRKHDRIVSLLTAFSYRERFYIVFPLATEGSLDRLWKTYVPRGVARHPATLIAQWYSDEWLVGECFGIADALLATHGSVELGHGEANGFLHADIKPENILCFLKVLENGRRSIVLKLADFGEAKRVKSGLTARAVAHVMTYRPPEHSPGNIITLEYDVWCLGCLFLDFIIWTLFGQDGVELFAEVRAEEPDEQGVTENPGQIIQDTFFKTVQQEATPSIPKRLRWKRKKEIKVESGRATTTRSVCMVSHVNIATRLKDAVFWVSQYFTFTRYRTLNEYHHSVWNLQKSFNGAVSL